MIQQAVEKTKYLYELKMPVKVYAELSDGSKYLLVDHLDGMYSFGKTEKGGTIHLAGGTPLAPFEDGYVISSQEK